MKSKKLCSIVSLVVIVILTSCFVSGCISTYYPINERISDGIEIGVFDLNDEKWQYRVWVGDSTEPIAQGHHTGNGLYFLPGNTTDVIKMGVTFPKSVTASYELDTPKSSKGLREVTPFTAEKELYLIYNPTSGIAVVTENFYEVTKDTPTQTPTTLQTDSVTTVATPSPTKTPSPTATKLQTTTPTKTATSQQVSPTMIYYVKKESKIVHKSTCKHINDTSNYLTVTDPSGYKKCNWW